MYQAHSRSGFSKKKNWLRTILLYLVLAASVYAGILFVPVLWRNHRVSTAMHEAANNAYREKTEAVLKDAMKRRVRNDTDIELKDEQIEMLWGPEKKSITIVTRYEQVVRFWPLSATVVVKLSPDVSQDLTRIQWKEKGCD